jgi:hypothetical protein
MLHATSFGGPQGRQFRYLYTADDERIAVIERKRGTDQVYRNRTSWTLRGLDARLLRVLVDDFTSGSLVQTWKEDEIWRGGAVLATDRPSSGTLHRALDHLGSPRAMATSTGSLYGTQTEWNQKWEQFLSNSRTRKDILDFARKMADDYGLKRSF